MRRVALPCVAAVALIFGGCGETPARYLATTDLATIAEPPPPLPKSGWRPDNLDDPNSFSLAFLRKRSESKTEKTAVDVLDEADFDRGYQKAWANDNQDGGSAQVIAFLFRDASGTGEVLETLRRVFDADLAGEDVRISAVDASNLGEDSWAVHAVGEDEEFAYAWRSHNLVLVVDMICYLDCEPADHLAKAARAYADAVDERVQSASR